MRFVRFKCGVETVLRRDYKTVPRPIGDDMCATRLLLNLKNLLVSRGTSPDNTMIGPLEYFGRVDPYHHPLPPTTVDTLLPAVRPECVTCNDVQWISGSLGSVDDSLFPDAGKLVLKEHDFLNVPVTDRPGNYIDYNVRLVESSSVTYDTQNNQKTMFSVRYHFAENYYDYAMTKEGVFLERHPFIQAMSPVDKHAKGFVMAARMRDKNIDIIGIRIPLGYTLLVDSLAIHGDSTLVGDYRMEMTADHVEMSKADTVFLKTVQGRNVGVDNVDKVSVPPPVKHTVKNRVFNPVW
jgi:hypothetical protein